ncbi:MAG: hypothetical protein WAO23_04175 [Dethiobacteria bacterium]
MIIIDHGVPGNTRPDITDEPSGVIVKESDGAGGEDQRRLIRHGSGIIQVRICRKLMTEVRNYRKDGVRDGKKNMDRFGYSSDRYRRGSGGNGVYTPEKIRLRQPPEHNLLICL